MRRIALVYSDKSKRFVNFLHLEEPYEEQVSNYCKENKFIKQQVIDTGISRLPKSEKKKETPIITKPKRSKKREVKA